MAVKKTDETLKAEARGNDALPAMDSVADPAPAAALEDASGAIIEPAITDAVDVSHESVDANPREGTTAAQNAIDEFAKYLRGNLDSIKRNTPVPFTEELEHIRIYLHLEKMRFEDDLRIVWDIRAEGFRLPALTPITKPFSRI